MLSDGLITWISKEEHIVALSTTDVQYVVLREAAQEARYISKTFLPEFKLMHNSPNLFVDNLSALKLSK